MNKVLWTVGLSNGETIAEEKGNFQTIEGELSPWQRLLAYIAERDVHITSLSLYTREGQRWNIPSAGKHPKFHAIAEAPKPMAYAFFRKMGCDVKDSQSVNEEIYAVAEAEYPDGRKIQVWVDNKTLKSWSFIV